MERITSSFLRRVELKSRKAWRGIIKFTTEGGTSRQISKTFPEDVKTKAQANTALVAWREEVEAETAAPDASLDVPTYCSAYIDGLEKSGAVEASTIKGYRAMARRIESEFSGVRLRDLTTKQVERWRDAMIDEGLSPVTVGKPLKFLSAVCARAVAVQDLTYNPCKAVRAPRRSQVEPASLDAATVRKLAARLRESEPTPLVVSATIALYTGMREGEVCALTWADVDLENHVVHVRRAFGSGKGGDYLKVPKNESSRRDVPLPSELVGMLERRRAVQFSEWATVRMAVGLPTTPGEFDQLFVTGEVDGAHAVPATISRRWASFAADNGIVDTKGDRAVFHTLRHTYASLLISQGYEAVTVAKLLGHAKPSMTIDVYAAAFEARKKSAAKSIGAAIGAALAAPEPAEVIPLRASNE